MPSLEEKLFLEPKWSLLTFIVLQIKRKTATRLDRRAQKAKPSEAEKRASARWKHLFLSASRARFHHSIEMAINNVRIINDAHYPLTDRTIALRCFFCALRTWMSFGDGRWRLTAAGFAEVQTHQLHHVRLEKVHVPPRHSLRLRDRTCVRREEGRRWAVDGLLRNSNALRWDLHRRLAGRHVQHWNEEKRTDEKWARVAAIWGETTSMQNARWYLFASIAGRNDHLPALTHSLAPHVHEWP